ncbi:hypothetical protein [Priestia megaterium]|uniref:hypothetical protein n=2 Tax=Priestia TaxID=2800373 RepID=UPI003857EA73
MESKTKDSCGENGTGETPQERKRGGGSAACTKINCGVSSSSAHISNLFIFRRDSFRYVSTSFSR